MHYLVYLFAITPIFAAGTPAVDVFLPPILNQEMSIVSIRAQLIANEIFSEIGLKLVWHLAPAKGLGCSAEPMHRTILIAFSWATPQSFQPTAMAYSNPYMRGGSCITIFMDRLQTIGRGVPNTASALFGHVLAHEIGHVLQGVTHHAETGILKEHWSREEIRGMSWRRLQFTESDKWLIHAGMNDEPPPL